MRTKYWKVASIIVLAAIVLCAVSYADKCVSLPAAVKAAINALYPQAEIEESKIEHEGLKVYEVELEQNGQEVELTIAADGAIIEEEVELGINDLPAAVKATIIKAANGTEIEEVKKEIKYMEIQLVTLKTPKISYEAEIKKDGREIEIEVAADGTLLKQKIEDDDDDNGKNKGDDDDDDNDDK